MTRPRHGGVVPLSPVVIERAGGGLDRVAEDPVPIRALRGLAREGAEILGAERTAIWRMGPTGMPIRCLTRFHRSSRTHEDDLAYPDELGRETWRLLERLSILAMEDVRSSPSPTPVLRNYLHEADIRALLAVPIRHRGQLAGFLGFEELDGPRRWTPRDREQAATLAFRLERHWGRVGTSITPLRRSGPDPREAEPLRREPVTEAAEVAPTPESGIVPRPPEAVGPPGSETEASVAQAAPDVTQDATGGATRGAMGGTIEAAMPGATPDATPRVRIEASPRLRDEHRVQAESRAAHLDVRPPPPAPAPNAEASALPVDAPAVVSGFGHRRELRARLQRLRTLERTGILGTRTAREVLHWLDLQEGTLALLEAELEPGGPGASLVAEARETLGRARGELGRFLGWARHGLLLPPPIELNRLVGGLAVRLGKLTGERVGLLFGPSSEPVHMMAEPRLLERCLEELVRNARAASMPGERVRVGVQRAEAPGGRKVARLVVEDRGTGIAAANLPWIFEPWFTTAPEPSDGFGLPFVQAVVEGHGGWVDVTSTEGRGSRFVLNFPLVERLEPEASTDDDLETGSSGAGGGPVPIALLVEDEPLTARLLRRALEGAGFRVLLAEGSPEAVRLVHEQAPAASLLVAERVLDDGGEGVELLRAGRTIHPYLGGILLDRRLRSGADDDVLTRVRQAGRIPSDVPLVPAPFDPGQLASEARRLAHPMERDDRAPEPASPEREEAAPEPEENGTLH
jgi:signal transduction histidine kinase